MEVTFAEVRRHLGIETQRQWSRLAIDRTTPVLLGLFSVVAILAEQLHRTAQLTPRQAAWYAKPVLTFSDAIAAVRRQLWAQQFISSSASDPESATISSPLLHRWAQALAYAA
jgi:hypothetical protein